MDWTTFAALTTAAATLATGAATSITLWLQHRARPMAEWEILTAKGNPFDFMQRMMVEVVNVGDGPAHQVDISGVNCSASLFVPEPESPRKHRHWRLQPVVHPGEVILVTVSGFEAPGAAIRVSWTPAPTSVSKPIIDLLPTREGDWPGRSLANDGPIQWRRRELRRTQLLQRLRQRAAIRARRREREARWRRQEETERQQEEERPPSPPPPERGRS